MNNADPESRAEEIKQRVASDELNEATKRLMDFVQDFSKNKIRKREVIDIRAKYSSLNESIRLFGVQQESNYVRLTQLRIQILYFVDEIIDEYQSIESQKTSSDNFPASVDRKTAQTLDKRDEKKTEYEILKDKFDNDRIKNSNIFKGQNICKTYTSRSIKFSLTGININLKLGKITVIVGKNGSGKTTLLRIVAGKLATSEGKVSYPCLSLNGKTDLYFIKKQIAYIPQELPKWHGLLADELHFVASIHGITGQDNEQEVDFITWRLGLEQYKKATWNEISGGYKMRLALAKALVCNPKLIILDEPLANLDINTQMLFLQDLRDLANSSTNPISIIISSQHFYEVEEIADNIIFLKDGQAAYNGSVGDIGKDEDGNFYEISCNLSKEEIQNLINKNNYKKIETAGNKFILHTGKTITSADLLKVFVENNISLKYFRDISKSTRIFLITNYDR